MYFFCKRWIKAVFVLPVVFIFLIYTVYPIIDIFNTSFKNRTFFSDFGYVGFNNWVTIFQDEFFIKSLSNTIIVVLGELVLLLPLGFLLGYLLNSNFSGNDFVKVATFLPYILSGVMIAIIWGFILNPSYGLINSVLKGIGLDFLALEWIGGKTLTPYSVVLVDTWRSVGFFGVLFLTGLKMIPKESFESALIDGASKMQEVVFITIPMLKETIKVCSVMIIIGAFNSFQTVYILTNGGPNNQSHLITTYLYKLNFSTFDFGKGAVLSTILFVCIMSFSIITLAVSRKRVGE